MGLSASRTLDDQHRRRLVMETDFDGLPRESAHFRRIDLTNIEEAASPVDLTVSLADCLPTKIWVYWGAGALAFAWPIAMLVGWLIAEEVSTSGSALADKLVLLAERMIRATGVLTWWFASQLSCLVWWARSRSRVDYSGRFHAWGWAAAGFAVAGLLNLVGGPQLAACLLEALGGDLTSKAVGATAIWLLPSLVIGLALWSTLGIELRGCAASRVLHSAAGVCGLSFFALELWLTRTNESLTWELASKLSLIVMQWCNLMTVFLHVHYTVHISADPPAVTPSLWLVVWRQGPMRLMNWSRAKLRRTIETQHSKDDFVDDGDESVQGVTQVAAESVDRKKRRVRLEAADGSIQEVRIDDAEQLAKGPSRRTKHVARKS